MNSDDIVKKETRVNSASLVPERKNGIFFNRDSCRFEVKKLEVFPEGLPLSVILQVTRRCNFSCIFCSEIEKMADPTLSELEKMRDNLTGVPRVYISGGEPLLRRDLSQILDLFHGNFIVGLPTNAVTLAPELMRILKEKVDFVNIGLDGPRNVTSRIRGDYDKIVEGVYLFKEYGIPLSLSCVVLRSTQDAILFTCQIADLLGAIKLKIILPIPKGNALNLSDDEYLTTEEAEILFNKIKDAKLAYGWKPRVTLTTWRPEVEGYSLLVYPDGKTYAWPVYDQEDKVLFLGNLIEENIRDIWARSPYQQSHYNKYLGKSIFVA
ncbi:MAG: radical SAM protein [Candidatus Azambacteria bacterium]|nr:radical SAM protein [Candidatus Azambacteria bacterium]